MADPIEDDDLELNPPDDSGEAGDQPLDDDSFDGEDDSLFEDEDNSGGGEEDGEEPRLPVAKKKTSNSAQNRIRELIRERDQQREMLSEVLRNGSKKQVDPLDDPDLDPMERRILQLEQQLSQQSYQTMDRADKADFRSLTTIHPLAKKYAVEVETELAKLRNQGTNIPREEVLAWIIGKKTLAGISSKKTVGTTGSLKRPTVPGKTTARSKAPDDDSMEALEARLSGVRF